MNKRPYQQKPFEFWLDQTAKVLRARDRYKKAERVASALAESPYSYGGISHVRLTPKATVPRYD